MASSLYACQTHPPICESFYTIHAALKSPLYSHRALFSPNVAVFRDDDLALLPEPFFTSIITSAAVNAGVCAQRGIDRAAVRATMFERIRHVLAVAHMNGVTHLVLGAFGCGVFKNSPADVAQAFAALIRGEFAGVFQEIVFAVPDKDGDNHRAFAEALAL